ncbi:MAG: matrixin family metalloprotease [Cyanobacteria bacterium SIG29]|nr:matrixin family metalloprotease [Cyanobacteria bacterium SIG29]
MEDGKKAKNKNLKTSLIIFGILLVLILGFMYYMKNMMPAHLMSQGKKYLEIGQYDKALKMFNMASDMDNTTDEPLYYKVLAISKMPLTYQNQKTLFEISQLDDSEKASDLAEQVLKKMRSTIIRAVGPNYIDNVLYEDQLIRFNNNKPIPYHISTHISVPDYYISTVKEAFLNWQSATNGQISFVEVGNKSAAKIKVSFVNDFLIKGLEPAGYSAGSQPKIENNVLSYADIEIKNVDKSGKDFTQEGLLTIAQHEIGHALGLWGHSADSKDIMHFSGDYADMYSSKKEITNRDVNTLMLVYKMVPDVIDEPLTAEQYKDLIYHDFLTTEPGENFDMEIQRLISELHDDRQNIVNWVDLAINYAYKKQYARSNKILTEIIPLVANDMRNQHVILYNLAANYYKMGEFNLSERYLNYATNIQDDVDTQILEAFLDLRLNRTTIAKEKLELLNKAHPENIEVALKLLGLYTTKIDQTRSKEILDELIKRNPKATKDRRVAKYMVSKRGFLGE